MEQRLSDIMDIVVCVLLAVICIQTGIKSAVDDLYEVKSYTSSYSEKNTTAKYTPSEKIYGTYDGSLTREELVLMTQIQDYEMYGPHEITYEGDTLSLNPGYEIYESSNRTKMWSMVQADDEDSAYKISYDYKTDKYLITKE